MSKEHLEPWEIYRLSHPRFSSCMKISRLSETPHPRKAPHFPSLLSQTLVLGPQRPIFPPDAQKLYSQLSLVSGTKPAGRPKKSLWVLGALWRKVQRDDKTGLAGESVSLYCEVDREMCGNVHSMKWSKGFKRLFIYSEDPYVENAEGSFLGRTIFHYSNETKNSTLEVFPMRIEDEGEYSCEITFFNAHEGCAMVQYVNLTIQALPSYPQLSFEDGSRVQNATTVGPFDEAEVLILNCESSGGKPVAQVTWYNGTHPIAGEYSTIMDEDGTGNRHKRSSPPPVSG
ncbi:hypothetical protein O3P69_014473 [Scylla paramamosain]|uniref:Ig-like domain-containing protein n=1 Tax=Scylla paramamosain TaxID=85552 RepID=A0AAW0TC38_SCYPA